MEDFISNNGKTVKFWSIRGEVTSSNKHSETYVESRGGGGLLVNGTGYVSAPSIETSTLTNHEFWIRTDDGVDECIKLSEVDIPVSVGQKITLIASGIKGEENGFYCILVNHNAKKYWYINNGPSLFKKLQLNFKLTIQYIIKSLIKNTFIVIMILLSIPLFLKLNESYWVIPLVGVICYIGYKLISIQIEDKKEANEQIRLHSHLEKIAKLAFNNI